MQQTFVSPLRLHAMTLEQMHVPPAPRAPSPAPAAAPAPHEQAQSLMSGEKHALETDNAPQRRTKRVARSARRPMRTTWPEEMEDDYEDHATPETLGGAHRETRELACFRATMWNQPYAAIMASDFYVLRFRPRIARIIAAAHWRAPFERRFMRFAEAGASHRQTVQLHLAEQQSSCVECNACGGRRGTVTVAHVQIDLQHRYWAFCNACDAAFTWVANCYSILWAVAAPQKHWDRQGFAAFETPEFVHDPDGATTAYHEMCELLDEGVEAGLYSPLLTRAPAKN